MNLQRYSAWARTWTRSQILFTSVLVAVALLLALYAAAKHSEMANIAAFWRQQYEQK